MMRFMQWFGPSTLLRTSRKLISLWLPVLLWMGLIFFLSAQPELKIAEGPLDFWTRKPAHVGEYAVLFILFVRALKGANYQVSINNWQIGALQLAFLLSFLYAVTDEFHQLRVPLREGKWADLGFDLLGIVSAILFLHLRQKHP